MSKSTKDDTKIKKSSNKKLLNIVFVIIMVLALFAMVLGPFLASAKNIEPVNSTGSAFHNDNLSKMAGVAF